MDMLPIDIYSDGTTQRWESTTHRGEVAERVLAASMVNLKSDDPMYLGSRKDATPTPFNNIDHVELIHPVFEFGRLQKLKAEREYRETLHAINQTLKRCFTYA